jgi:hypothetical protein
MEEMVEPDRTIMIVSIIGLVVIWGSFFYHKFVQGGGEVAEGVPMSPEESAAGAGQKQKDKKKNEKKG